MVGIRWDEHPARSSETYFSPREDHMRVHPILHFTEKDVWSYIRRNNVPYNPLYDKGYRSLGAKIDTEPVADPDAPERAGREKEKEKIMERLRELGYF
jgi:phosphoadenosine phosphosulfate reductase